MVEIDKSKLQLHNPWWVRRELILEDPHIKEYEEQKFKWIPPFFVSDKLKTDAVLTLRGPRRVGKTTALKLLIKKFLLEDNFPPQSIFLYSCDRIEDYKELYSLLSTYIEFAKPRVSQRLYIFLDEISFVSEWQRAIKSLIDEGKGKGITFLLTGSNILDLRISGERLPGRRGKVFKPDIEMLPLSFSEFLRLVVPELLQKSPQEAALRQLPEFQKFFEDFILTGGFLATINQFYSKEFIPSYSYETYLNWVEGDLHKTNRSEKVALRIIERVLTHLTTPVSLYKLAKESGLSSHATVSDYLDILEKMFVLFSLNYISISQRKVDYKKNQKFYFLDPFIQAVLAAAVDDFLDEAFNYSRAILLANELRPKLAEVLVGATLKRFYSRLFYGGDKEIEIDFVGKRGNILSFFEVKYAKEIRTQEILRIKQVLPKNKITLITQKDYLEEKELIEMVPLEIFLAFPQEFCK